MRSRKWLWMLGLLASPGWAAAQTVTEADLVGGWRGVEVELPDTTIARYYSGNPDSVDANALELVLWPDHLWSYEGPLYPPHGHGGARWRLVGDTLWLGNDYEPYYHPILNHRWFADEIKGLPYWSLDRDVISNRPPLPVSDSVYWSSIFRDTTTACAGSGRYGCGTWVYQVSRQGQRLSLVFLDRLSRRPQDVARKAVLERETPAAAQSVTLQDLVGTWEPIPLVNGASGRHPGPLIIRADSTFRWETYRWNNYKLESAEFSARTHPRLHCFQALSQSRCAGVGVRNLTDSGATFAVAVPRRHLARTARSLISANPSKVAVAPSTCTRVPFAKSVSKQACHPAASSYSP